VKGFAKYFCDPRWTRAGVPAPPPLNKPHCAPSPTRRPSPDHPPIIQCHGRTLRQIENQLGNATLGKCGTGRGPEALGRCSCCWWRRSTCNAPSLGVGRKMGGYPCTFSIIGVTMKRTRMVAGERVEDQSLVHVVRWTGKWSKSSCHVW
jgi:hypothetical protein